MSGQDFMREVLAAEDPRAAMRAAAVRELGEAEVLAIEARSIAMSARAGYWERHRDGTVTALRELMVRDDAAAGAVGLIGMLIAVSDARCEALGVPAPDVREVLKLAGLDADRLRALLAGLSKMEARH